MNISEIKQSKAVNGWVDFAGQIKEVKEIKQRTKSNLSKTPGQQYNVQKLVIQDETDIISMWAYANQQFSPGQFVTVHGMLKEYQNVRYLDYTDVKPANQTTPQSSPQAPKQPAQATNYQQPYPQQPETKKQPDWDAISRGKVRHGILCAMLQGGITVDYEEVLRHTVFVMTGIDPASIPDPHSDITEPPSDDSEVPF